ncbi:MAG: response regulator transcription factor [Clostridia bacterium]|nr:response regulator transcription factor [Clostridia bacterium]
MATILLVEDNVEYRKLLAIHMRRGRYDVLEANDGQQALQVLNDHHADLIVADIMMPNMDGLTLISFLRKEGVETPILVVTAKEQFDAMRESFRRGADDYLIKPVRMEELLLRVEALLRRTKQEQPTDVKIGSAVLDAQKLCVCADGQEVPLRLKEFRLLEKLAAHAGKIFTRQELMDDVWGYDSESDPRTVDTHIKRLREKLESISDIRISTVRGLGYRMEKPL